MHPIARLRRALAPSVVALGLVPMLAGCALTDGLDAGRPAPELAVDTWVLAPGGRAHDLAALRGRHVLLEFWSLACPHCRDEVPEIQRLHETYGPRGLVVVTVHVPLGNARVSPADVARYAKEAGITFAIGFDADGDTTVDYDYGYLPHAVLVTPDGRVAWSGSLSFFDVEDRVRAAVGATR